MVFTLGLSVGDDVKWQSAIDRALGTWESVVEWADYISFLSRVQKAIKNKHRCDGSQLPLAPQISEMLARCLEPSLPAGVHQTCLDVYDSVFTILGPVKLGETINIWLPGLLPVVSWAAFNVKPLVIQLFVKYVIPAAKINQKELKELYRPLQLSLLQSIEDELSDCYTEICEILETLERLSQESGDGLFWQCFYLCVLTSPDSRLGALTYLQKHEPDRKQVGLFIRAVCGGLEDQNVLVQRGFLDLLAKHLPLKSTDLQNEKDDFRKLMLSACRTIFRKDMSLNRRLRLWLMGPEHDTTTTDIEGENISRLEYLRTYASETLIDVLLSHLETDMSSTCAIAQGLMDRWEIAVTIAPPLMTPILQRASKVGSVDPNVALFFDNVESDIVWTTILSLLDSDPETALFTVQHFDVQDEEMLNTYIPLSILYILSDLDDNSRLKTEIALKLISVLPPQELPSVVEKPVSHEELRTHILERFGKSLENNDDGEEDHLAFAPSKKEISWYLIKLAGDLFLQNGSGVILNSVLSLFPSRPGLALEIPESARLIEHLNPGTSDGVRMFIHIVDRMTPAQVRRYVQSFVQNLANCLTSGGHKQLEKVKELWSIHEATDDFVVPSSLCAVLADTSRPPTERAKIFAAIWTHSVEQNDAKVMLTKPLLLFIDLKEEDKSLYLSYLQSSIVRTGTTVRLVKLLLDKLDVESRGDECVFSYVLERFVGVLHVSEIRTAYISKYAPLACTLLLEWFDKSLLPEKGYAHALELAEITVLDSRIKDGKVWLRRFVDALTQSYVKEYQEEGRSPNSTPSNEERDPDDASSSKCHAVPVALVRFATAAIPQLDSASSLRLFIEACVTRLRTEVDYEVFNQLLAALLSSEPRVEYSLLQKIVQRLDTLYVALVESKLGEVGDVGIILHLFASIELILATGQEALRQSASASGANSSAAGSITSALTGFQVESPEDRSRAEASHATFLNCLEIAIAYSCKFWLFLQRTTLSTGVVKTGEYATALHITGRLKTRLRKLMTLCYSTHPYETLRSVATNIPDLKFAVRMTHMFEGARIGATLEILLDMATKHDWRMFEFSIVYVDSLETDVLGDVWPTVSQFLNTVASSSTSFSSALTGGLAGLTLSINGGAIGVRGSDSSASSIDSQHIDQKGSNSTLIGSDSHGAKGSKSSEHTKQQVQNSVLAFLTQSILPRFDQLKFKNRKKVVREFADVYSKLVIADIGDPKVVGDALRQMSVVISEPDRQATLLSRVLNSMLKTPQDVAKGADLLTVVSSTFGIAGTSPAKTWTRHIGDFLFETRTEDHLMPMTLAESLKLKPVVRSWVQCDKERVRDFTSKLATYGSSTGVLFGWSGTKELANSNLRRFAYLSVCTPTNVLGVNWSKLTNQLASMWEQNAASVCILLRACMLGQPSTTLVAFMAYRLQATFEHALKRKTPAEGEEAELLLEACKLIDLALVVGAEQFQPFEWLFISDNGSTVHDYIGRRDSATGGHASAEKTKSRAPARAGGILERLGSSAAIPKRAVPEQLVVPTAEFRGQRRPLLPLRATLADLPAFLSQISFASHEEVYSMTVPDREFCEKWLLADLFK